MGDVLLASLMERLPGLQSAAPRAEIDLARPQNGLALQVPGAPECRGVAHSGRAIRRMPSRPKPHGCDAYVRGDDLVATYEETAPRRVRAQIYWRCLRARRFSPEFAEHIAAAFDLIVSVNTSLLDSDPQSRVRQHVSSAEKLLGIAGKRSRVAELSTADLQGSPTAGNLHGFIVRPAAGKFSYVEIVHPAESAAAKPNGLPRLWKIDRGTVEITQHLFQQRLEKGVILRGWIRAALVAREHDEAAVLAAYQHFVAAEPPLTV